VELGEIDAALVADPALRDAVTLLREAAAGQKRLVAYVVPAEAGADRDALVQGVRARLKERLPEYMVPAAFVVMEALPLTSNNKVDRKALPAPEPQAADDAESFAAAGTPLEDLLARIWAEVLKVERVGIHDNFFELGGDSILSIQVISRAAQEGIRLTPKQLFQFQTVAELAPHAGTAAEVRAEQGAVVGEAPLTPIQRVFFEQVTTGRHHWNQAFVFTARERIDAAALERALGALATHHDALRLRYAQGADGRWTQRFAEPGGAVPLETVELVSIAPGSRHEELTARATDLQASLDLENGPIFRAALFDGMEDGRERLLLAIHHLAVDAVSWGVLLEDLATAYGQAVAGAEIRLPRKTTSFRQWAERLVEHAGSEELRREAAYWSAAVPLPAPAVPTDRDGANTEATAEAVGVSLDEEETRALLHDVPPVYGTQINDVLLTALVQAFGEWTGKRSVLIDLEGHGREDLFDDVDISRTVGWFTSLFPVHLEVAEGAGPGEAIKAVKETLRRIPNKGIGYGLLRYLCPDGDLADMLRGQPRARVSFNYLGQFDAGASATEGEAEGPLFAGAPESPGPVHAPEAEREHLIQVDGAVQGGRLHLTWWYGAEVHDRATIERLANGYIEALRGLIAHCKDPEAGGFTPSDFPAAMGLDQSALDSLLAQIGD
jgi:non-ribosomal peptide synthase protein (TIGR01720 family)